MFGLENHSSILGDPGTGFHSHLLGVPLRDYLGTVLIGIIISLIGSNGSNDCTLICRVVKNSLWAFLIGEVLHIIFGVQTQLIVKLKQFKF